MFVKMCFKKGVGAESFQGNRSKSNVVSGAHKIHYDYHHIMFSKPAKTFSRGQDQCSFHESHHDGRLIARFFNRKELKTKLNLPLVRQHAIAVCDKRARPSVMHRQQLSHDLPLMLLEMHIRFFVCCNGRPLISPFIDHITEAI